MNTTLITLTLSLALSQADTGFTLEPGFKLLLNGKDLTGWRYKDGPAFDGKTNSSDGRYSAKDGKIIVNPGKGLAQMWTVQEFPTDFHLKLEFRAEVNADSGIFLRKPQLQCRDYLVAGPYKDLKKYKAQDWNVVEVTVKDAKISVDGTDYTSRLSTKMGWELSLEQGLVTAKKGELTRVIPVGNVAYMIPPGRSIR